MNALWIWSSDLLFDCSPGSPVYSSSSAFSGKVPAQETALPYCTAMDSLWKRNVVSLGSPVTAVVRRPSSEMKLKPSEFHGPKVSTARGPKVCVDVIAAYFCCFQVPAWLAAARAEVHVVLRCDAAIVPAQVASQARHLPLDYGIKVAPSGLRLIPGIRPEGSLHDATFALINSLQTMSLMTYCLCCRPALLAQDRPW